MILQERGKIFNQNKYFQESIDAKFGILFRAPLKNSFIK